MLVRAKKWTKEELLLAEEMHIAEKMERLEQNLMDGHGWGRTLRQG